MAEINTLAEPTQNAKVSFLSEQVVKLKENLLPIFINEGDKNAHF